MRSSIAASGCLVAFVGLLLASGPASAQPAGSCGLTAAGGWGFPVADVPPVEGVTSVPGFRTDRSLSLRLGFQCDATSRLAAGLSLEWEELGGVELGRVLAALDARVLGDRDDGMVIFYTGVRVGWGPAQPGPGALTRPDITGGLALGTDLRLEAPLSDRVSAHLTGAWRAAWLTRSVISLGLNEEDPESAGFFHSLPVTVGMTLRL